MDRKVVSVFAMVAAALMAAGLQAMAQTTTLVSTGSVWKYLDNGSDQGTAWRGTSFNDGTWSSGAAQLGFGDGDETTVLKQTNNAGLTNITYYFRRTFNVDDANFVTNLLLRVLRDDGVVVYLNGTEVYRNNMPAGDVNNQTLASTAASDDGTVFFPSNPSASLLTTGPNVLAVEVHQNATSSTDVSFDLELISNFTPTAPVVSITSPASGSTIAAANVTIRAAASDVDGTITVVEFFQAATKLGERTVPDSSTGLTNNYSFTAVGLTPGTYTFYVKATDNTGLNTDSATVVVQVQAPPPTLLARGSTWKYLDGGTNPGPTWTTLNYDDSAWASGTAPLGDNLEGTLQYCVTVVNIGSASARGPGGGFR